MRDDQLCIVTGNEVTRTLSGRELDVVAAVEAAYRAHQRGESSLPHSTFLRFPGDDLNRIIALPAFLGDGYELAGMKWVSSVPGNVARGMERASAVVILNSLRTGRPFALLEGSLISAQRTAASAALAARVLLRDGAPAALGLLGTGVINREIVRYLMALVPGIRRVVLFDLDPARAASFAEGLRRRWPGTEVEAASAVEPLLAECLLVSYATTAVRPHLRDLSLCPERAVHLHVSLRDLTPEAILACDNVVDDPDHVCRAQTSVHLAEQLTGGRDFIRCSLGEILEGTAPPKRDEEAITIFSPFGLGILDLAVAKLVFDKAVVEGGAGIRISSFFPSADREDPA
ncbi:MAG TPA: 2,3-diaminopropionate biosynthesis protein SbnB [Thermoanaerobaculia bacterium]|nr:2,3-diaminopropionate biosynthesis protein SbnB [Thermoanaerobaculia bacterium]